MRGRKPKPTQLKVLQGNPGKRRLNTREPRPPDSLPRCPTHLSAPAKAEWRRLAPILHGAGVLTQFDRAAMAAYCQAYGRWVEAERKLQETPTLLKTPSGYVQQSPWLSVSNKQLELMGRYMAELGLTPAARSRVVALAQPQDPVNRIEHSIVTPAHDPQTTSAADEFRQKIEAVSRRLKKAGESEGAT